MAHSIPTTNIIVKAHHEDGIATITIDNIKRHNIMTLNSWYAIPPLLAEISKIRDIRLIVIQGAGEKAFIAGADISEFDDNFSGVTGTAYDRATVAAFQAVRSISIPTIATIRGYCIGGGLALALSCDIRLCTEDSLFSIPAARLGLAYPDEAVHRLKEVVGDSSARDIIFTAKQYSAVEAYKWESVNYVYPNDVFADACRSYSRKICENAPLSLKATKITLEEGRNGDQNRVARQGIICLESADYKEGRLAFSQGASAKVSRPVNSN